MRVQKQTHASTVNWFSTKLPRSLNGKCLSTNGARTTGQPHTKGWSWTLTSYHVQKIDSKWIKDLNIGTKTIKLTRKHGSKYSCLWIWQWILAIDMKPKAQATKEINKLNFNIKTFCASKNSSDKAKRLPTVWEKKFANYISDKGPMSRIYINELWQPNNKK